MDLTVLNLAGRCCSRSSAIPRLAGWTCSARPLSLAAVLSVIYGLKRIAEDGLAWLPVLSIVAGVGLGVAFLRRQRTLSDPLIDIRLFRIPAFSASLATYLMGTFVAFGAYIFIAQYLQLVLGLSPLTAGLGTVPSMAGFIAGSILVPMIARRVRSAYLMGLVWSSRPSASEYSPGRTQPRGSRLLSSGRSCPL